MTPSRSELHSVRTEVRKVRLLSKKILASSDQGEYRSAFHGTGLLFSELRDYHPGDDVKRIAWKPTARTGRVLVKSYQEERQHNIIVALDISSSMSAGNSNKSLSQAPFHAATLAHLALASRDRAGLVTFTNDVCSVVRPSSKRSQLFSIVETLLKDSQANYPTTDLSVSLRSLHALRFSPSIVFVISDFFSTGYTSSLRLLASRHDVVCILLSPDSFSRYPDLGIVEFADAETGERITLDTALFRPGGSMANALEHHSRETERLCRNSGADFIEATQDIIAPLRLLMSRRGKGKAA